MSRSTDTQHTGKGQNIQMDYGTVILGDDGEATVYTQLNWVRAVVANSRSSLSSAALQISVRTEAASPYFTVTDPAGPVAAADVVNYIAFGV